MHVNIFELQHFRLRRGTDPRLRYTAIQFFQCTQVIAWLLTYYLLCVFILLLLLRGRRSNHDKI